MKLTKKHKIYGAVLGIAASVFAVDTWVIRPGAGDGDVAVKGRPGAAAAAAAKARAAGQGPAGVTAASAAPGADGANPGPRDAGPAPTTTLANRLQTFADAQGLKVAEINNAFRPSDAWVAAVQPPAPVDAPAPPPVVEAAPVVDPAEQFRQRHRLLAVMKTGAGGLAIVDGKTLRVGQTLEGFRLISVTKRSAVLRSGKNRVELKLEQQEPVATLNETGR